MEKRLLFNEDEYNYDKSRPTYPNELFQEIVSYSRVGANSKLLEIGIGTGQATLPFLKMGSKITAIELGDRLSVFVEKKFSNYANFKVINDDFMFYPFEEEGFDLIYCATGFHWLPVPESYEKLKRYLKRDGAVALFWNHPFPNRKNDISNVASKKVYDKFRPSKNELSEFKEQDCKKQEEYLERFGFKDIKSKLFYRKRTLSTNAYIQLLNTYSDHRSLEPLVKRQFEKEMSLAIDSVGGKINIYDTIDLYLARK